MMRVHRAERADRLVDALAEILADPLDDPMASELIAVPSRGIERWLAQELSGRLGTGADRGDGVCANIAFPFPSRVVARALGPALGSKPDEDPWAPRRLLWPVLELIDAHLDEPWLALLRAHLGGGPDGQADPTRRNRRLGTARRIAYLFDRYAVHRPDMLGNWARQRDLDGRGRPLPASARWQPELWRRVRERLDVADPATGLNEAVAKIRDGEIELDLPPRLSVFGLTSLPASYARVLAAVAEHRDVHLLVLHPSPALWERVGATLATRSSPDSRPGFTLDLRDGDSTRSLPRHPLLASWGHDARELQVVLAATGATDQTHHGMASPAPDSLLARLQADVLADSPPPGAPAPGAADTRFPLEPGDRSVQIHACHGRTRQVEVLRDAILHLLADDPTLEPRDIVVMCPDIETFAPLINAVFEAHDGQVATGATPDLRVRLADRSLRQTNLVLRVLADVLGLADSRVTASQVLDLAVREPVRRRFRFDDEALTLLEAWVTDARVRWGLDGTHRAAFGLAGVSENTWRSGLDRLLLGVTMADADDRLVGATVPLDDVEGSDVELAGRFAEFLSRLTHVLDRLRGPQPLDAWSTALEDAAALLTATTDRDRWQHLQVHRLLAELREEATGPAGGCAVDLSLAEIRTLLEDRLRGRPSRANHRTGDLTVCTLVPMRSVPHRVVCLVGMDDGALPRQTATDGDDLMERDPVVGDRDVRTEDRQLLLDALLAARQHLVITYTGRDERTNEPRPPAVPIGELLDVVDRTARATTEVATQEAARSTTEAGIQATTQAGEDRRARDVIVTSHPLQAYDPANFTLRDGRRWGFDPVILAGARARASAVRTPPPFLDAPLAPIDTDTVELAELVRFVGHPVRAFLRERLGVSLNRSGNERSDALPVELDPLDRHAIGERLLRARRDGGDVTRWLAAERSRGLLPPGAMADPVLDEISADVDTIIDLARAESATLSPGEPLVVDLTLPGGSRLVGTVPGVCGATLLGVSYSRVAPKHRLAAWIRFLAATAQHPELGLRAATLGRAASARGQARATVARIEPLATDDGHCREKALELLQALVDLYERGMREPLPLYCKTSAAYAQGQRADEPDGIGPAARAWSTKPNARYANEDAEPEHLLVLGGAVPFEALLDEPPCAGEDWSHDEPHRFGRYARRLWDGLLDVEEVVDQ